MNRRSRLPRLDDGEELFSWKQGFSADYNGWSQKTSIHHQDRHPRYVWPSGIIETGIHSDPPHITQDGCLRCWVNMSSKDRTGHCEWKVRHENLHLKTYLRIGHTYAWEVENRLNTIDRVWQYPNTHVTWFQGWGSPGDRNPCVGMQVYRGKLRVQSYGDTCDNSEYIGIPDGDWHEWLIIYTPHPQSGSLRVWMDKSKVYEVENCPTCYTADMGPQNHIGCYTVPTAETMSIDYRLIRMVEL